MLALVAEGRNASIATELWLTEKTVVGCAGLRPWSGQLDQGSGRCRSRLSGAPGNHCGSSRHADLWAALRNPEVIHGMLEDYRAGLTVDRAADDEDRARGRKIQCPLLVGWSSQDDLEHLYGDVLAVWRSWADDVRGVAINSGHHMAEEAPRELARELRTFFVRG